MSDTIDFRDLGDQVMQHIANPESELLWAKEVAAARDGMMPSQCPHPMSAIEQFVDEEPGREGRPTNLFQCDVCKRLLRLIDAHGKGAVDG